MARTTSRTTTTTIPALVPTLLAAAALAACDAPTAPASAARPALARAAGASPVAAPIPLGYSAWQLDFAPAGINDDGVVVGTKSGHAVRWESGALATLLPHLEWPGQYEGRAINRGGRIVGNRVAGPGMYWESAAHAPQAIVSSYFADYNRAVTPRAINWQNVVVGDYQHIDQRRTPDTHAFRWSPGRELEDITPPGYDHAVALDVNEWGYVVGYAWRDGQLPDAVRWAPDAGNAAVVLATRAEAAAIRENGSAVGAAQSPWLYIDAPWGWTLAGQSGALAAPQNSHVDDVSNPDRVVGATRPYAPVNPGRPWTTFAGETLWLPVPDERETARVDGLRVNACGSIVGTQHRANGTRVGLLWTKFHCDLVLAPPKG
jgi:hypothetical protein